MIYTIQEKREDLQQMIWEVAKDATGVRPRWLRFDEMSIEEMESTLEMYAKMAEAEAAEWKRIEEEAIAEYEALVQSNIELGAGDRETAVRWIVQSECADRYVRDVDSILYHWDMPYFEPKLPAHIKPELEKALASIQQET